MDDILKQMDGIAETQKEADPEFYITYKNARVIVDNAASNSGATTAKQAQAN